MTLLDLFNNNSCLYLFKFNKLLNKYAHFYFFLKMFEIVQSDIHVYTHIYVCNAKSNTAWKKILANR